MRLAIITWRATTAACPEGRMISEKRATSMKDDALIALYMSIASPDYTLSEVTVSQ